MSQPTPSPEQVVGLKPWFPWPLSRWNWWTQPVRAERLAALRIGIALLTLVDVSLTYLPHSHDYFGAGSIGPPSLFTYRFSDGLRWSLLQDMTHPLAIRLVMLAWAVGALLLLVGLFSRGAALLIWVIGVSVANANSAIDNAGDAVRTLATFYLVFSPCAAAWSVDAWVARRYRWLFEWGPGVGVRWVSIVPRSVPVTQPFYIHPWPLRLLFVQMMVIYLFNGLYKATGHTWHEGTSLYYVLGDQTLTRWPYAAFPVPFWMTAVLTVLVLWWEMLFAPAMLIPWKGLANRIERVGWLARMRLPNLFRWNREIILCFGASFHLGILSSMEIGWFPLYMLCLYLPLVPWEWFRAISAAPTPEPIPDPEPVAAPSPIVPETDSQPMPALRP